MSGPPPSFQAVLATPGEKRIRDELCHEAWGDRLSVPQFVAREERLRECEFARTSMFTWLLVERGDARRRPLASLETFTVESRHGMRRGRSFAVASVFTERSLRGRGHASRLLEAVAAQLGSGARAQAMTLYSDVGAGIYERAGYVARPAFDWHFPAARERAGRVTRHNGVAAVAAALAAAPPRGRYALLPGPAQIEWHRARERIYAAALDAPGVRHGVLRCDAGLALIAGDLKNERLVVLALRAAEGDTAQRLLSACADEAAQAGLAEVVAWAAPDREADRQVGAAVLARGGRRSPREGALPMLRPLAGARGLEASAWSEVTRALWV